MEPVILVMLSLVAIFALIMLHVPVGIAMTVVGVVSFGLLANFKAAFSLLASEPASIFGTVDIAVIPLFLLMGSFANAGGLADDIYRLASALVGRWRGGVAMATVIGCGLFGSIAGSSVATTATFGKLALPQMRDRGYEPGLAAGTVAAGGTLGAMVPPSIILVVYGVIAEQFILDLFVAVIIPAILAVLGYLAAIWIYGRRNPDAMPTPVPAPRSELREAARNCIPALILFGTVSGGIYGGVFTVTEAASVGALLTFVISLLRSKVTMEVFLGALRESAANTAMIYISIIGASIMTYFVGLTQVSDDLARQLAQMDFPPLAVIGLLVLLYLILGAIFDEMAAMLITLPFVLPVVTGLGYDPVWWGVIMLVLINLGMMTPPIGMNVFLLNRLAPDIGLVNIYRGVMPFILADLFRLALLILVPSLSLFLVGRL
ncbi:TRAP transporter large permease [Sulfitobacter sp. G21635-S1]|uniref:TRAP transporter large permease n=1 Tax=Sulfitobacter sp. G21635-S1 TaxID=3014043 RepID=UPI0022B045D1|nr:TRAP transporter large permease [Sulfitobacter sp. G21635-S1]MCZ4256635.1 TRAP transporter large permease [Sulfitobacter sp. G21635-S1]